MAISSPPAELMTDSKTHPLLHQDVPPSCVRILEREKGTNLVSKTGAQEEPFRLPRGRSVLGRTCQGVTRGAEQGPLLLGHPYALRGQ